MENNVIFLQVITNSKIDFKIIVIYFLSKMYCAEDLNIVLEEAKGVVQIHKL